MLGRLSDKNLMTTMGGLRRFWEVSLLFAVICEVYSWTLPQASSEWLQLTAGFVGCGGAVLWVCLSLWYRTRLRAYEEHQRNESLQLMMSAVISDFRGKP